MSGYVGKATRRSRSAGVGVAAQSERADAFHKLPGQIVSFDPATQTATVKIMYQPTVDGEPVDPPELLEVPVVQPRGGGFAVTAPLGAGDWVELSFDDVDTSGFRDSGVASAGGTRRMNSLSDAVATPGRAPSTGALPNYDASNFFMGTADGNSGVRVSPDGKVELAGPSGTEDLVSIIHELLGLLAASVTTPVGTDIQHKADYAAIQARVASMKLR